MTSNSEVAQGFFLLHGRQKYQIFAVQRHQGLPEMDRLQRLKSAYSILNTTKRENNAK